MTGIVFAKSWQVALNKMKEMYNHDQAGQVYFNSDLTSIRMQLKTNGIPEEWIYIPVDINKIRGYRCDVALVDVNCTIAELDIIRMTTSSGVQYFNWGNRYEGRVSED